MVKFYVVLCIIINISCIKKQNTTAADIKIEDSHTIDIKRNAIQIDSIFSLLINKDSVNFITEKPKHLKCDTIQINKSQYKITREIGAVKQIIFYDGVENYRDISGTASDTKGKIIIPYNNYISTDEVLASMCFIDEPQNNKIKYNNQTFSYYIIEPDIDRAHTASASSNSTYLIFTGKNQIPYERLFTFYTSGSFIFGDVDMDGNLDFLELEPLIDEKDINKLTLNEKSDYEAYDDIRGVYYIIKAMTYRNKEWAYVQKNSSDAYVIIKLVGKLDISVIPLDFSNKFEILSQNWF